MADSATDCSHTYLQPSTGETGSTFPLTATVRMEVTWSSNTGQGGTLPAISRSSTQPVTVSEILAVGTR
jgi:enoyl reductase